MGWVKGPEVPSRREERMDGQRCVLWVFLVKMQAGLSVNHFEKRGQWTLRLLLEDVGLSNCNFCSHLALGGVLLGCNPAARAFNLITKIPGYDWFQLLYPTIILACHSWLGSIIMQSYTSIMFKAFRTISKVLSVKHMIPYNAMHFTFIKTKLFSYGLFTIKAEKSEFYFGFIISVRLIGLSSGSKKHIEGG